MPVCYAIPISDMLKNADKIMRILQPRIRKGLGSIEKESSDFQIYIDLYFIADNTNIKYLMFCLANFISLAKIHPFLSFRPTTQFRANQINWLNIDVI